MLNCQDRLAAGPANRMARLAGIDAHRVRQWLFARSVQEPIGSPLMGKVATRLAPHSPRLARVRQAGIFDDAPNTRIWTAHVPDRHPAGIHAERRISRVGRH
jgi:hypothetical protein